MPPSRSACWVATGLLSVVGACGLIACGDATADLTSGSSTQPSVNAPGGAESQPANARAVHVLAELFAVRSSAGFATPADEPQRNPQLQVELPAQAEQPLRLSLATARDPSTGQASELGVEVRPLLDMPPRGNDAVHTIERSRVLELGASSWVLRPNGAGVEDFWRIPTPTSPGVASVYPNSASALRHVAVKYELALSQVAGLRLVDSVLEVLDSQGTPRLRMRAPYAFDAQGKRWPLTLSVLDCQVDISPKAPWRRPVTPPGNDTCQVQLSFDSRAQFPVWVDPQWTATGSLAFARTRALQLVADYDAVGGVDAQGDALASVERYDVATGTWAMAAPLSAPRADPQEIGSPGKPLIVGGGVAFAERYNLATQRWEAAGATANRVGCGTGLGAHAVFVGAPDPSGGPVQVEYQTSSGEWQVALADNPPSFREGASCLDPLNGGKVMLWLGGREPDSGLQPTTTWLLKPDPSLAQGAPLERVVWEPGPDIGSVYPRGVIDHSSLLMGDHWQIFGGQADGAPLDRNTVIRPVGGVLTVLPEAALPRAVSHAALVHTGSGVWLAGGVGASGEPLADVYLLDPAAGQWRQQPSLLEARQGAQLAQLADDGVLAVGGEGVAGVLASVEVFAGGIGAPCGNGADCRAGHCSEGICCDAACDGPCETCRSRSTRPGTCVFAVDGDPTPRCTGETSGVCPATLFCGADGECLTLHAYGDCGTTCQDGLETRRICNEGSCQAGLYSCGGYRCDGDRCGKSCGDDADCAADYFCRDNVCAPLSESCGECYGYPCDPIKRQCDKSCTSDLDCDSFDECRTTSVGKYCVSRQVEFGACGCFGPGSGGAAPALIGLGPLGFGLTWLRRRRRLTGNQQTLVIIR